jgi:hypothetical protein
LAELLDSADASNPEFAVCIDAGPEQAASIVGATSGSASRKATDVLIWVRFRSSLGRTEVRWVAARPISRFLMILSIHKRFRD